MTPDEEKAHLEHVKELEATVKAVMENDELVDAILTKLMGKVIEQINSYVAKWLWQKVLKYVGLGLAGVGLWILVKLRVIGLPT